MKIYKIGRILRNEKTAIKYLVDHKIKQKTKNNEYIKEKRQFITVINYIAV